LAVARHGDDLRVGEHRGVELRCLFGLVVEPQARADLLRELHDPSLLVRAEGKRVSGTCRRVQVSSGGWTAAAVLARRGPAKAGLAHSASTCRCRSFAVAFSRSKRPAG